MAEPLVPKVDIRLDLLPFHKHCCSDFISVEDERPPFSAPLRKDFALFFDVATEMRESNLHPLVNDLSNLHQILRNFRDV